MQIPRLSRIDRLAISPIARLLGRCRFARIATAAGISSLYYRRIAAGVYERHFHFRRHRASERSIK
jgi:hypothetical protein